MTLNKTSPILLIIFLFPILVATVQHGGSTLFALLLLTGLALGWPMWRSLEVWEKKILIGFLIFFLLVSLSLFNTENISSGIKKEGRYVLFPLMIPTYLLIKKLQLETGKIFLFGLIAASIVLFGQALYQIYVLHWSRAIGAYNSLVVGDISMLAVILIVCALITVAQNWLHYLIGVIAIVAALSASAMAGARGAWILLPISLIWFMWIKRKFLGVKLTLLIVLIGIVLSFLAFSIDSIKYRVSTAVLGYQAIFDGPEQVSATESIRVRVELWRNSITIWKAHPLFGTGIGDFKTELFQSIKNGESRLTVELAHAHNIYFDTLATAGLVGLFGMIIFMQILPFKMFYSFWKKEHDPWLNFYSLSGMTTIIAFAVFGLTEGWLARKPFVLTYVMCIVVFMSSIAVVKLRDKEKVINHES